MTRRSYTRSKPPIPKAANPAATLASPPTPQIEWKGYKWGRVGWCSTSRSYSVEILGGSVAADHIKNRPDVVRWLAERGIIWDPAREAKV